MKIVKYMISGIMIIFLILSVIPYLITLQSETLNLERPFYNSLFVDVSDTKLHYRVWRSEDIRGNILLVHGLGGSTFSWEKAADILNDKGYFVIAVDLPAFGYSSRESGFDHSQENRSDLLWKLVDEIEMSHLMGHNENWTLVGHSTGGGTVATMAVAKENKVKEVILVAGALFNRDPSVTSLVLKYPPASKWMEVLLNRLLINEKRVEEILLSAYGRQPDEREVNGYLLPLKIEGTERALVDMVKSAGSIDFNSYKNMSVPIYGIWGTEDKWVELDQAERVERILPHFMLYTIEGAGHMAMETHVEECTDIILNIID
ncbi:alpha/beta fold hydrolase [Alkalibacter saccharofermentans]|uniref:Pimeloyl-ACP methyl ester carboxylesterase n=1 Tax=Alkalibacter saccharofermentans DSM 14828 TaxID=1120975 RepID=A0A1M4XQX6_9FIRM|nr:alpha/beta hydrolase [Alkalibacter saccharofermentans]SHE95841.1 Pimeloyl-ACP methyl ester carboxylesterase [Alkalibacter saccharofermentans DSM 14828]